MATMTIIDEGVVNTFSTSSTQTLHSLSIEDNCGGGVEARITARRVSDGATKVFFLDVGFKRETGDLTVFGLNLLPAKGTTADLLALAAVLATIDASSGDLRVRVTGLASEDIDWGVRLAGEAIVHV